MAIASLAEFRDLLAETRLVPPDELAAVLADAPAEEPRALAKSLVARQILTRWQAEQLWAGRRQFLLGKYRLLDKLGQGGMGAVYRARQMSTGRIVAIKVMAQSLLDNPDSVARFHREVQSAAALNHPNIVAAYDAGEADDGASFLVMEHVPGRDLNDWLKECGRLPIDWACECIRQAALGLQHAHERGLVHRDIKPGNLLVVGDRTDEMPRVKILDMGLARLASEKGPAAGELTHTGQILGTPDYIAPEQAKSTKTADIRADIFSLGCTLFKLLTGEVPFRGETLMEKLMARASEDAPLASTLRPEVPPELDAVIARMLARQAVRRYQLPREAADALAPFSLGAENGAAGERERTPASDKPFATAKERDQEPLRETIPDDSGDRTDGESSSAVLRSFLGNLGESDSSSDNSPAGLTTAAGGAGTAAVAVRTRTETRTSPSPEDQPLARRFEQAHAPAPQRGPSTATWAAGAAGLAVVLCVVVWKVLPDATPPRIAAKGTPPPKVTAAIPPTVSGPPATPVQQPARSTGAAPAPCTGRFGQGIQLTGKELVSVTHRAALEPREFTVEAWVWLEEIAGGKEPRRWIVNKNTNEHAAGYFALLLDGDRVTALVNVGGGADGIVRTRSDAGAIKPGRWQHVAMSCNDTTLTVWCDGKLAASQGLPRPRPTGAKPLVIGSRGDEYGWFQGKLDEIRLFGRSLTAEELARHASCDASASWRELSRGLVESWSFESTTP
jgi:serine/threonine protein kinase